MPESVSLSFDQTGQFSALIEDYQRFHPNLRPFIRDFPSVASILEHASSRPVLCDRALLMKAISDTFSETEMTGEQRQSLKKLSSDRCFSVTAGHQLNLLGGPMYVVYKIQAAINLCRLLNERQNDLLFVPVFWLASEDHDLHEINHFRLLSETFTWDTKQSGAVGRMNADGIGDLLSGLPISDALFLKNACLRAAEKSTLAQGAVSFFTELFGSQGLLILNADHRELKEAFMPFVEKDLYGSMVKQAVDRVDEELVKSGYHLQARASVVNYFLLSQGRRERLDVLSDGKWRGHESGTEMSAEEWIRWMKSHPESVSPNVITRPVYQEFVLPNAVFIGGGGEVAYWLQLSGAFEAMGVPMPILSVRNSFLLMSEKGESLREKLGLKIKDLFLPKDAQIRLVLKAEEQLDFSEESERMEDAFRSLAERIGAIDSTLVRSAEAEQANVRSRIEHLRQKALRALKQRNETKINQLDKLLEEVFPGGTLQERSWTLPEAMMRCGENITEVIRQHSEPLNTDFKVLIFRKD
jgi:bacillithiol synthase